MWLVRNLFRIKNIGMTMTLWSLSPLLWVGRGRWLGWAMWQLLDSPCPVFVSPVSGGFVPQSSEERWGGWVQSGNVPKSSQDKIYTTVCLKEEVCWSARGAKKRTNFTRGGECNKHSALKRLFWEVKLHRAVLLTLCDLGRPFMPNHNAPLFCLKVSAPSCFTDVKRRTQCSEAGLCMLRWADLTVAEELAKEIHVGCWTESQLQEEACVWVSQPSSSLVAVLLSHCLCHYLSQKRADVVFSGSY